MSLEKLTLSDFEPLVDQSFTAQVGDDSIELQLIEAKSLGAAGPDRKQPFSILLRCATQKDECLPQATYSIENETLGKLELFLVPLGPEEGGMCYEAVFA